MSNNDQLSKMGRPARGQMCGQAVPDDLFASKPKVQKAGDGAACKQGNSFFKSFGYAAQGVMAACGERNFRFDCVVAVFALLACAILSVPAWGWAVVVICIGGVLACEAFNSALEAVVDLASPELHPLAKRAKDCAAGATLLFACASAIAGLIVYVPAIMALFQ